MAAGDRRRRWLLCIFFGLLTILLGAYLLVLHLDQKPIGADIFLYFAMNAAPLGLSVYLLRRTRA